MRAKYIEERYPQWFVFGLYPDGRVDVYDGDKDVAAKVTPETAEVLIREHNSVVAALVAAVMDLTPEKQTEWLTTNQRKGG